MAFNIEEIKSTVNSVNGLMKPNLFALRITYQPNTTGEENSKTVGLLCNAVNLPGVSFATADVARQGYGHLERRVANAIFPAVSATFMLDNKGHVLEFFANWSRAMSSFAHQKGELSQDEVTGGYLGQVGYYDKYTANIQIIAYAPDASQIVVYNLIEAYPAVIGDVSLGWRQNDEVAELQVQFNYRFWNSTVFDPAKGEEDDKGLNIFQFVNKLNGAVQIAKSLKRPRSIGDALNVINNGETLLGAFS